MPFSLARGLGKTSQHIDFTHKTATKPEASPTTRDTSQFTEAHPRVSSAVVDTANTIAAYGDRAVLIQKKPFATPGWVCGEIGPKNTAMIQRNAQFDGADFDASMAHVPVVLQALNRTAVVGYGSCAGNREGEGLFYAMPVPTPVSEPEKK